ncbi:MAG: prepilin-type N-terminal cleavage/methylation domain-containing protein [Myxococcota bacterium]|jgi:prepilin-type N-terminal cleavage/methylation domain-containing protein
MINSRINSLKNKGFTLMEMMVVLLIIGILSGTFVVNAPGWIDKANMTASQKNMSRIYATLLDYQGNHDGAWPRDQGQKFFLRPWKDGMVEKTEQQAKMYFSPSESFNDIMLYSGIEDEDLTMSEYLSDWEAIGPGYTSYAGFTTAGDRDLFRRLRKNPGSTAIVSDAHMIHRTALLYLTADGATHRLNRSEIEEVTGIDLELDDIEPGPGCEMTVLQTVSND